MNQPISPLSARLGHPAPSAPADPAPSSASPSNESWAQMLVKLQQFQRDVHSYIRSDEFVQKTIQGLLAADTFNEVLERKFAEFEARLGHTGAAAVAETAEPKVLGFNAHLVPTVDTAHSLQAVVLSSDHPTRAGQVELFQDEHGDGQWTQLNISDDVASAIRKALIDQGLAAGNFYGCSLMVVSDKPYSSDSFPFSSADGTSVPSEVLGMDLSGLAQAMASMASVGEFGTTNAS